MLTIQNGINALSRDEFEEVVQEVFSADELIIIAAKDGVTTTNLIGYPDNMLAMNDLIESQHYVLRSIYHSDYPPDII